jgi:hypothetical protein
VTTASLRPRLHVHGERGRLQRHLAERIVEQQRQGRHDLAGQHARRTRSGSNTTEVQLPRDGTGLLAPVRLQLPIEGLPARVITFGQERVVERPEHEQRRQLRIVGRREPERAGRSALQLHGHRYHRRHGADATGQSCAQVVVHRTDHRTRRTDLEGDAAARQDGHDVRRSQGQVHGAALEQRVAHHQDAVAIHPGDGADGAEIRIAADQRHGAGGTRHQAGRGIGRHIAAARCRHCHACRPAQPGRCADAASRRQRLEQRRGQFERLGPARHASQRRLDSGRLRCGAGSEQGRRQLTLVPAEQRARVPVAAVARPCGRRRISRQRQHLRSWRHAADRRQRTLPAERHRAGKAPVQVDRAAAHPLRDARFLEAVATHLHQHDGTLRPRVRLHAEHTHAERVDAAAGKHGQSVAGHADGDLGNGNGRGRGRCRQGQKPCQPGRQQVPCDAPGSGAGQP